MANEISNTDDIIDVRDVIERYEELAGLLGEEGALSDLDEQTVTSADGETDLTDEAEEFKRLEGLLDNLRGNGGDHQWKGAWYPAALIHESYFEDYARQYAEDVGAIEREDAWPCNHIDWGAASADLRQDYSDVDFDGEEYLYR